VVEIFLRVFSNKQEDIITFITILLSKNSRQNAVIPRYKPAGGSTFVAATFLNPERHDTGREPLAGTVMNERDNESSLSD